MRGVAGPRKPWIVVTTLICAAGCFALWFAVPGSPLLPIMIALVVAAIGMEFTIIFANAMLPTIVITGHADVPMAVEAMKAGALDFIEKPFEDEVLLDAIGRAIGELGKHAKTPHDASAVRERMSRLTEREQQVMRGIVAGLPNKTIAYDLDISPRTVEVHRANVMAKMQARNLPELVRMVLSSQAA